jgi:threonine aldolase
VAKARPWRKRYGAGMRQAGILAAAGHFALDNNIKRLADDHKLAKSIAKAIYAVAPKVVNPDEVDTNIVGLDLTGLSISAAELSAQLKENGILGSALGPTYLRLVTHMDVTEADIAKVNQVLPELLQRSFVA